MSRSVECEYPCVCGHCVVRHCEECGRLAGVEPFDLLVWAACEALTEDERSRLLVQVEAQAWGVVGASKPVFDADDVARPSSFAGEFNSLGE